MHSAPPSLSRTIAIREFFDIIGLMGEDREKTIFEYDDYRRFLADYYDRAKAKDRKFSFRFFSRIAGFKSSNFLYLVMKGKSNISPESCDALAKAMKLNREESLFFKNLVLFNQAKTSAEKQAYSEEMLRSRTYQKIYPLSEAQYKYFGTWYFTVVRGLVGIPEFQEDPEWIAARISPEITPAEARKALEELLKLGLIHREPGGRLAQTNANITSASALVSSSLAHFHREMMARASEAIDRFPRENRDLSAMTVGISVETAKKIKELAEKFRGEIVDMVSKEQTPDVLYQLNVYLFPVTALKEEKKS
jgi:uncharacterized protein (TIGR02147 family)